MKIKKKFFVFIFILLNSFIFFSVFAYSITSNKVTQMVDNEENSNIISEFYGIFERFSNFQRPNVIKLNMINQNKRSDWEKSVIIVDQDKNGINDRFELKMEELLSSEGQKSIYNGPNIISDAKIINYIMKNEQINPENLDLDKIPIIIHFPDENFQSCLSDFEELGGSIKSIYKTAINGFAGSIDYIGLIKFYNLLRQNEKSFLLEEDEKYEANLYYVSRNMYLRPYVWNNLSFTGDSDSSIAVVDSGIDDSHNFNTPGYSNGNFNFKIVGWRDEVNGLPSPYDDNGHGSHCAGIATGEGSPNHDGSGRSVATHSLGFDWSGYYVYEQTIDIIGARFNVTDPGTIQIDCEFDDYTSGSDAVHVWAYLYRGETVVDSYVSSASSWSATLTYTATGSTLGDYSLRYSLDFDSNDGDIFVLEPHMRFRGEIHWPFNPPLIGCGDAWKGVAHDTHLVGVKVLDNTGSGWVSDIISGINWVISNKLTYNITTMSISIGGATDSSLINAVNNAVENGIVTVVAAGNGGAPGNRVDCPGNADKVITVAAMSDIDRVTEYSSSGGSSYTGATIKPDIMAPGGSDHNFHTFSTDTDDNDAEGEFTDDYSDELAPMLGTSMATPAVAGAVNLLIQAMGGHKNWTYSGTEAKSVKALLLMTATETYPLQREVDTGYSPSLQRGGKDVHEGYGRINIDAAIEAYTQMLNICSSKKTWLTSSIINPFGKHAFGCHVDLLSGQDYNFHLIVPDNADFDLYLYNSSPSSIGEPILEKSSISSALGQNETIIFSPQKSGRYYLVAKAISGEGNATLIWNHTRLDGIVIGSVIAHGEDNPLTKYSDVISDLIERGAIVKNITSKIDSATLSSYSLIWFDAQGSAMTTNEIDAIQQWVQSGGRFLVTGDNVGSASNLLQRYNIYYGAMAGSGSTTSISAHPVTIGVEEMNFPSPAQSLNISLQLNAKSCVTLGGYDMVVALKDGLGRILVIIDDEVFTNYNLANNSLLINNTFGWLGYQEFKESGIDLSALLLTCLSLINQSGDFITILIIICALCVAAIITFGLISHRSDNKKKSSLITRPTPQPSLSITTQLKLPSKPNPKVEAWSDLGDRYRASQNYEKAYECYEHALKIDPYDKKSRDMIELLRPMILRRQNLIKPPSAIIGVQEGEKDYYELGMNFFQKGNYQKAIFFFEREILIHPKSKDVLYNLGIAYMNLGQTQKAIGYLSKVLEIDPEDNITSSVLNSLKSDILNKKKIKQPVIHEIQKLEGRNAEDYFKTARSLFGKENYESAIDYYKKAINLNPKLTEAWYELGIIYSIKGDIQNVIECNKKVVEIDPKFVDAWNFLGSAYIAVLKYQDALVCLKKAVEINPNFKESWRNMAIVYKILGDYQKWVECKEKAK